MTKRKPYSRRRVKQRINGLTEILQEGVNTGDLPEIAVSHVLCSHLWEIEEHAKLKERLTAAHPKPRTRNHWKGTR